MSSLVALCLLTFRKSQQFLESGPPAFVGTKTGGL